MHICFVPPRRFQPPYRPSSSFLRPPPLHTPQLHVANAISASKAGVKRNLQQMTKPVDPLQWFMTPSTVNAYYEPTANQMVFPAGILQRPFFGANQLASVNYGAMGVVMGHELSHGFDDQGRQYDGHGDLKPWWTPETVANFKDKAQCFVDQCVVEKVVGVDPKS